MPASPKGLARHIGRPKFVETLIHTVETANEGSRRLDGVVSYLLGETDADTDAVIDLILEEGYAPELLTELSAAQVPPYSTTLDAKIPGENIVLSMYASKKNQWVAIHRSSEGADSLAWARTECLARRAAALKGGWARVAAMEQSENDESSDEQGDGEQEKPWKILF